MHMLICAIEILKILIFNFLNDTEAARHIPNLESTILDFYLLCHYLSASH